MIAMTFNPKQSMSDRWSLAAIEERDQMRKLSEIGGIIAICERAQFKNLRSGFLYACHTILEKIDENTFLVRKDRESGDGMRISLEDTEKNLMSFSTAIFVISSDTIINVSVSDMDFPNPVSNWYKKNRGMIYGKKFGL